MLFVNVALIVVPALAASTRKPSAAFLVDVLPETFTVSEPGMVLMISKPFCDVPVVPVAVLSEMLVRVEVQRAAVAEGVLQEDGVVVAGELVLVDVEVDDRPARVGNAVAEDRSGLVGAADVQSGNLVDAGQREDGPVGGDVAVGDQRQRPPGVVTAGSLMVPAVVSIECETVVPQTCW